MTQFKNMMQQAQQLQAQMANMQQKLESLEVEATSGGGLVKMRMTGKGEAKSLQIDPSLLKLEEKEVLEDLIVACVNEARAKTESLAAEEMSKLTGNMKLPGGFKLPF